MREPKKNGRIREEVGGKCEVFGTETGEEATQRLVSESESQQVTACPDNDRAMTGGGCGTVGQSECGTVDYGERGVVCLMTGIGARWKPNPSCDLKTRV